MTMPMRVACVVPTRNGGQRFRELLGALHRQATKCDLLIVDSGSSDGTPEAARSSGATVERVPPGTFNHGGTRQLMVERHPYDFYVFLTQDALPCDENAVSRILAPFGDERVGAVCGRQLARPDASPLGEHARRFSYPGKDRVVDLDGARRQGINAALLSNSFAAYRASALRDIGGFPRHVIVAEDRYVAAKMLLANWHIAYASEAVCWHSHDYTVWQEFQRYFDMGVFMRRDDWIRRRLGSVGGEGARYVLSELRFLGPGRLLWWPGSLLRSAAKLCGYSLGRREALLPVPVKRKLSMQRQFWSAVNGTPDSPHHATPSH